jgi:protein TonB
VLAASAIRYRVPPAIAVPMASRRLGEAGTVLLRVWVDAQGLPRQVSVHRSSGFARLDEQAIAAMREARFQPVTDGGSAIDWVVIAPLQYEID